ncbi:hypothetical protein NHX12_001467 [Muraenolepis orangiensis]|uniref:Ig-like domain-containing protein n=1 Tax=Muraenolepis orangiensis TaxID=630683 RepID=A0A9Q0DZW0_9TELE|nr:hypothetical protein NHX12_001467 [Muraenolepis orangiensis]
MLLLDILLFAVVFSGKEAWGSSLVPSIPDRVLALAGSCVVVPCSYPLPTPLRRGIGRVAVRLRFRGGSTPFPLRSTAFNSEDPSRMSRGFLGRTTLSGRISEGDCSLRLDPVHLEDSRPFEIALKSPEDWHWGTPSIFTLEVSERPESPVISGPASVTEGQPVSLNCTVGSFCPSRPPALRWHWERGGQPNVSDAGEQLFLQTQRPLLLSSLSFTASHLAKPRLRCEATYPGGAIAAALREVHVTFAPREVRVEVQSLVVHEGGSVLLGCVCKADPPATAYHWSYILHSRTVFLATHAHGARIHNVTRGMLVRCTARNPIGRADSHLTPLDILYKPLILRPLSSCVLAGFEVTCLCVVDSNPRAVVRWSVNGSVPSGGYNVSVAVDSRVVRARLHGQMDGQLRVTCLVENELGDDSLTLLQRGEEVVRPSLSIRSRYLHQELYFFFTLTRDLAVKTPLYINCTEVTHVYSNGSYQVVYQNATPLFVRTNQVTGLVRFFDGATRPIGRRGGERRGRKERGRRDRETRRERSIREETETAIYIEIL